MVCINSCDVCGLVASKVFRKSSFELDINNEHLRVIYECYDKNNEHRDICVNCLLQALFMDYGQEFSKKGLDKIKDK